MQYWYSYEIFDMQFTIVEQDGAISRIDASKIDGQRKCPQTDEKTLPEKTGVGGESERRETDLIRRASQELEEYFRGERKVFDLPLAPEGTAFQQKVWRALREIPYGETVSYGEIAKRIGSPKASRAVGKACNRNPILIMIPCHRVIGADGSLTGFGSGLDMKARLLSMER